MVSEISVMNDTSFCVLPALGVVRVSGQDAAAFLQDHLCNDVNLVTESMAQLSGYCTPKGRLLAIMTVTRHQNDYYLVMHESVVASVVKRLNMFAMMPRPATGGAAGGRMVKTDATLTDVTASSRVFGFFGSIGGAPIRAQDADSAYVYFPHDAATNRSCCIVAADKAQSFVATLVDKGSDEVSSAQWELADVRAGFPQITADTQEAVVPQMANMHSLDGISFKKGCYPGQEIVARMHYLGKLKRVTQRFLVTGGSATVGQAVVDVDGKEVGVVLRVADTGATDEQEILAVIKTDEIARQPESSKQVPANSKPPGGGIKLDEEAGAMLTVLDLPYSVQIEASGESIGHQGGAQ